ncbi:uncharacterized protein SCDLUD_003495 [Saccharomycodes ludwigii]|uniref:uncharacterized protein n=1 Tax=Saccharomycodes ludwigii TaxID=36035 RepID=UPI001E87795F|nr:hypothetical protein SCDLUD_003495 [Saccharomycodes ludwigii]KAH3900509.1 hypothetical protein SCDLUD_003495 [Saccharomycodes ludwigii]
MSLLSIINGYKTTSDTTTTKTASAIGIDSAINNMIRINKASKNLVLCFDGTSSSFGPSPFTNILKIFRLLDNSDDTVQLCYYQPGVGNCMGFDPALNVTLSANFFSNLTDSLFAFSLDYHIMSAYLFLMKYYERGDRIYMFGFSRGAFTARILAGMIERVGLLNKGSEDVIYVAWKMYKAWEYAAQPSQPNYNTTLVEEFRATFARPYEVRIHFQGLFDSVNSVGLLRDRLFPFSARSGIVDHVRHAVSIDERRGKFKQQNFAPNPCTPLLFSLEYKSHLVDYIPITQDAPSISNDGLQNNTELYSDNNLYCNTFIDATIRSLDYAFKPRFDYDFATTSGYQQGDTNKRYFNTYPRAKMKFKQNEGFTYFSDHNITTGNSGGSSRGKNIDSEHLLVRKKVEGLFKLRICDAGNSHEKDISMSPDLIEMFFPGDHSDVGGGWVPDTPSYLYVSTVPLRWMLSEAIKSGVKFKLDEVKGFMTSYPLKENFCASTHDWLSFFKINVCWRKMFNRNKDTSGGSFENTFKDRFFYFLEKRGKRQSPKKYRMKRNNAGGNRISTNEEADEERNIVDSKGFPNILHTLFWWFMELIPIGIRLEDCTLKWRNVYIPNFGRSRHIPEYSKLHWSVLWRIKYSPTYRPKNIPRYAKEMMYQVCGIDIDGKRKVNKEGSSSNNQKKRGYVTVSSTIVSPHKSYPSMTNGNVEYSCNLLPSNEDPGVVDENCPLLSRQSPQSKFSSDSCDFQIYSQSQIVQRRMELEQLLNQWEAEGWENIPDELAECLY